MTLPPASDPRLLCERLMEVSLGREVRASARDFAKAEPLFEGGSRFREMSREVSCTVVWGATKEEGLPSSVMNLARTASLVGVGDGMVRGG